MAGPARLGVLLAQPRRRRLRDSALEASAEGVRALKISLAALAATAVFQVVIVAVSGSVALLGDTIHNFADALTAVPLGVAFVLGRRRPTKRYTYGYGRAEDLAGIFIVTMIALSAAVAGWESIQRLRQPQEVRNVGWGDRRRAGRLRRQRAGRRLPHPGGQQDRLGRAGR